VRIVVRPYYFSESLRGLHDASFAFSGGVDKGFSISTLFMWIHLKGGVDGVNRPKHSVFAAALNLGHATIDKSSMPEM
jgi:hypothetical protein